MNNFIAVSNKDFEKILDLLNVKNNINKAFIYDVYKLTINTLNELKNTTIISHISYINDIDIVQYILGEYLYSIQNRNQKEISDFESNDEIKSQIAGVVTDKYLYISKFVRKENSIVSNFSPIISSLCLYVNVCLNILESFKTNNPSNSLISDLLFKSFQLSKCIINLLQDGFETQALSCWRTLHECEATLITLTKFGPDVINSYLKHMEYGIAFKDGIKDKNKQDDMFDEIKKGMSLHDLKSKDMKKYIEYGWLYSIKDFKEENGFKLNFRDGLEKIADLSNCSDKYQLSSEIVHSTPMLIYSNKQYFFYLTILSIYESFFRIEKIFSALLASKINEDELKKYFDMKEIYYSQLLNIYKRELTKFSNYQNK